MKVESTFCREIDEFNQRLADNYGIDAGLSKPTYRIAWTTFQFEPRYGTYVDYSENGTYLCTVTETRVTFKYPLFEDMWVLEKLQGNDGNSEIDVKWSYEPLHIFGAGNSDPNPIWDKVVMLVSANKFVDRRKQLSNSDLQAIEDARFLKEKALCKTIIQDNSEFLVGALVSGAAVSLPKRTDKE